jgi:hypothetical protein
MRRFFNGAAKPSGAVDLHRHYRQFHPTQLLTKPVATGELVRIVEFEAFTAINRQLLDV